MSRFYFLIFFFSFLTSQAYSADQLASQNPAQVEKSLASVAKVPVLTFTAIEYKGEKIWLPVSTEIVPGNYVFNLVNTLDAPHGFEIKGLTSKPIVVPANDLVSLPLDVKAGEYKISCHLHPAHVGAKLLVK